MNEKLNIILFITHDQGQFLGCYNTPQTPNSLHTPNLDNLAENGVRFTNYFCTAPQCSPSRSSILTSLYPHQNGLMGLVNLGWTLPSSNKTLPMHLKEAGYSTHLIGLQHESRDPNTLGYETVSKRGREYKYSCRNMEKKYKQFLSEHKNDEAPFYACFGVWEAHRPLKGWADPANPSSVKIPPYLPDDPIIREDLADYYSMIHVIDNTIGNLINLLDDTNLRDNTLFIYTTDHGEPFPRAKCTLYDPGIKTSLIMSSPNSDLFSSGKTYNQMISNVDLLPTLLDLIGADIPKKLEGKSFLQCLIRKDSSFRENIFTEKSFHEFYDPLRAIRTKNYKFIINFKKYDKEYQIDEFTAREPIGKYISQFINSPRRKEELYDLNKDPKEVNNLAYDTSYKDIKKKLKEDLYNWMKSTNDPILEGKINDLRRNPATHY
ncbi:MAG: sulfatase [Candidatus Hermodarchaeota archaeon]